MAEEFYIRNADSEEVRGPYTIEKLATLHEAGQVTRETLFFDDQTQQWYSIASNDKLRSQVMPERKQLSLKPKTADDYTSINSEEASEATPVLKVEEMLASAEGKTTDTRHAKRLEDSMRLAGRLSTPTVGLILMLWAAAFILPFWGPSYDAVAGDTGLITLLRYPLVLAGVLNAVVGVLVFLGMADLFPVARFLFMVIAGCVVTVHGYQYVIQPDISDSIIFAIVGGFACLAGWFATIVSRGLVMLGLALMGIGCMAGYIYLGNFA